MYSRGYQIIKKCGEIAFANPKNLIDLGGVIIWAIKKYKWELEPVSLPITEKNCPRCNEKSHYINTEGFRVNDNKSNIDVWLIYQFEKCKSTWNMTIYERIKPYDIDKCEYEKLLSNDKELAKEYAFNLSIYNKNKAEVILEAIV